MKIEKKKIRIKKRVRKHIYGTQKRPRLSIYKSNKEIYAQLIDDDKRKTLAAASSRDKSLLEIIQKTYRTKIEKASLVGNQLAKNAKKIGITSIVFDRNRFIYHGRIKALAEGVRKEGIKF